MIDMHQIMVDVAKKKRSPEMSEALVRRVLSPVAMHTKVGGNEYCTGFAENMILVKQKRSEKKAMLPDAARNLLQVAPHDSATRSFCNWTSHSLQILAMCTMWQGSRLSPCVEQTTLILREMLLGYSVNPCLPLLGCVFQTLLVVYTLW